MTPEEARHLAEEATGLVATGGLDDGTCYIFNMQNSANPDPRDLILDSDYGVNKETGEVKAYPYLNILYGDVEATPI